MQIAFRQTSLLSEELEYLQIEKWLLNEKFESVMGGYVI